MLKKIAVLAVVLLLTISNLFAGGGKIKWITDYDKGMKEAKENGRAVMLYFHSDT